MPYVTSNLKLVVEPIMVNGKRVSRGRYNPTKHQITVDDFYASTATAEELAKTIIHELVHSLTSKYINQYVDSKGNLKPGVQAPKEITDLIMLFNETRRKLGKSVDKFDKKLQAQRRGEAAVDNTERELEVLYAGTNIKEFVTLVMTEPAFQKEMSETQYMNSSDTLLDRLAKIMRDILKGILGTDFDSNTVTAEGVMNAISLIEKQFEQRSAPSLQEQQEIEDAYSESLAQQDAELRKLEDILNQTDQGNIDNQPLAVNNATIQLLIDRGFIVKKDC